MSNTINEEIVEGNKLIAEFMGLISNKWDGGKTYAIGKIKIIDGNKYAEDWTTPKYHSSWDWLMPVVEKINKSHFDNMRGVELIMTIHKYVSNVNILDTHKYVVKFIKWYNQQKQQ